MLVRNFKRFSGKVIRQPRYSARVAVQRARAYLAYYMDNGFARAPEAITFFLTYRCNLRCRMCGQWGDVGTSKDRPGKTMERDISFTELKNIVDDIAFFRPNITLFGGEPLLHHHVPDLVRHIKHNGLHCLMITNGSLLGRHGDELIESGLDELNVSLDGAGKLHDEIRGVPGLYYRVIDGLRHIARMKEEKKLRTPLVNLQCTINRYNYRYLDQMIEVAKEVQADALTFHNLIFLSSGILDQQKPFDELLHCSSSGWKGFLFEPSIDPDILHENMKGIMSSSHGFPIDFYPNFSLEELRAYYENHPSLPGRRGERCISPWMTAYIFPGGELRPCLNSDYSFGNLKTHSFSTLWNSERAISFRRVLREHRSFPACLRCTELYRY